MSNHTFSEHISKMVKNFEEMKMLRTFVTQTHDGPVGRLTGYPAPLLATLESSKEQGNSRS